MPNSLQQKLITLLLFLRTLLRPLQLLQKCNRFQLHMQILYLKIENTLKSNLMASVFTVVRVLKLINKISFTVKFITMLMKLERIYVMVEMCQSVRKLKTELALFRNLVMQLTQVFHIMEVSIPQVEISLTCSLKQFHHQMMTFCILT